MCIWVFKIEQKEADSQKELEREAALKRSFEELEAKNEVVAVLEKQVKELEQKLQLADTKSQQKACFILNSFIHAHKYIHI